MNTKILDRLCIMFKSSPQLMDSDELLQQAINGTFGVDIKDINFTNVKDLTELIHYHVLKKYFATVWQPITKKYKYSGLSIIDEVNNLKPLRVLDLGCGYNEFKGKNKATFIEKNCWEVDVSTIGKFNIYTDYKDVIF